MTLLQPVTLVANETERQAESSTARPEVPHRPPRVHRRHDHPRKAPGIGHLLAKPFESATKWMTKSGSAGRKARGKTPV